MCRINQIITTRNIILGFFIKIKPKHLSLHKKSQYNVSIDNRTDHKTAKKRVGNNTARFSKNTLYQLERGQGNPSLDIITKLAEVLGMELKLEVKKNKL